MGEKKALKILAGYTATAQKDETHKTHTKLRMSGEECSSGDVVKTDGIFPCAISEIGSLQKIVNDEEREKIDYEELEKEIEEEFANEQ